MTVLAAKIFRMCLVARLDAPFGGNLAAGASAEALARELRNGVPGLLRILEEEGRALDGAESSFSLNPLLMEVWTLPGDDQHLLNATGKTRDQWLAAPLWVPCQYRGPCQYALERALTDPQPS